MRHDLIVVDSIPTQRKKIFNILFFLGIEAKRGVVFLHSTHNEKNWKCLNGEVSYLTLVSQVPSAYPVMFAIKREPKRYIIVAF